MKKRSILLVVMPPYLRHSDDYLTFHRVCLHHAINQRTGRTFCGRNADGWDMPYRTKNPPTVEMAVADEKSFCKRCAISLRRSIEVTE